MPKSKGIVGWTPEQQDLYWRLKDARDLVRLRRMIEDPTYGLIWRQIELEMVEPDEIRCNINVQDPKSSGWKKGDKLFQIQ